MSGNKASTLGDVRTCPNCNTPLPNSVATTSSSNVFINGKPALRAGDTFSPCVCPGCNKVVKEGKIVQGSSNIFINGMPMAFDSCSITGGGVVIGSSSNVVIGSSPINIEDILPEMQRELSFNTNQPIINYFNENTAGDMSSSSEENNKRYSIQFCISDTNGNRCDGMFYTIKIEDKKEVIIGETDEEGHTEQVFSEIENDKAYLYIGHRQESFDNLLIVRTTDEHIHDELILNYESVDNQIMTLFQENQQNKICQIRTQRLWKPWLPSENIKNLIKSIEVYQENFYDLGDGGITIGYGHFTPYYLDKKKTNSNPEIEVIRSQYPNGITLEQATTLFEEDLLERAQYRGIYELIKTPLYQYEFDALICMRFNILSIIEGTVGFEEYEPHARLINQKTIRDYLNSGQYTQGGNRIATIYNSMNGQWLKGVQNRRNCEKNIFLQEIYNRW